MATPMFVLFHLYVYAIFTDLSDICFRFYLVIHGQQLVAFTTYIIQGFSTYRSISLVTMHIGFRCGLPVGGWGCTAAKHQKGT